MRVIAGDARGRPLRAPKGGATRPTSDKVRGAIFSMLESLLWRSGDAAAVEAGDGVWAGKRVLDLYAGSGALGIEALSRGAESAVFVDQSRAACAAAEANLRTLGLAERAQVRCQPVVGYLRGAAASAGPCDIILADPPYANQDLDETLVLLSASGLVGQWSVVVVEHARGVELAETVGELTRTRARRHGGTAVSVWVGPARLAALAGDVGGDTEAADEETEG